MIDSNDLHRFAASDLRHDAVGAQPETAPRRKNRALHRNQLFIFIRVSQGAATA
ncbi:hypothetical protein KKP04_00530 [Rhodomicrobium sp. Az07]|uniref:hypothetical protein n=1 Tax=Rhodomicrobium sp. Az07 TaxID=2839034 RepID=UPI001BE98BB0|nr:hypothetical protein [Rhodomicrobium sp. Az07]MBT3069356.1 hypothetical protein [Rhodomicrobium sp. Az07]